MKESPFGFQYSWEDIKPVRPLFITIVLAQIIGAAICLFIAPLPEWFNNIWLGGAIATFPGYILGFQVQLRTNAENIKSNKTMVYRMGYISLALTIAAIILPNTGLINAL